MSPVMSVPSRLLRWAVLESAARRVASLPPAPPPEAAASTVEVRGVGSSEVNMEARRDCREDSGVASKLEDDYSCCWPGRSAP